MQRSAALALSCWVTLGAIGGEPAAAHEPARKPRKAADADVYRPSVVPDRILLSWEGDPATTQSVTWRTDESVVEAYAEIAPAGDGPNFKKNATRVTALTTAFQTDLGPAAYHAVTFEGLTPKTRYAYRVGDGENWSEWIQFTTAGSEPEPFSFVYFGDAQNDIKSHWSRVVREAYRDAPRAAFMLHAGDLVSDAHSDAQWGEWHYAASHIQRMIPCIATPGNHEYDNLVGDGIVTIDKRLSTHWRPQFCFPLNGPEGEAELEETTYWIDYQGARIISLNSNRLHARQAEWLDQVLAENPQRWTIITFHHPIFSSAEDRDNPQLRAAWQPVFDRHRVDLVLQGHDHSYARTSLEVGDTNEETGVQARSAEAGTVYVVSVSGPKMYELGNRDRFPRVAEDTQLYQIITVDGDELRYEARTANGTLYDGFTLRKRDGEPNELIEQVPPDKPENEHIDDKAE